MDKHRFHDGRIESNLYNIKCAMIYFVYKDINNNYNIILDSLNTIGKNWIHTNLCRLTAYIANEKFKWG